MANLTTYAAVTSLDEGMFMHTEIDTGGGFVTRKFTLATLRASLNDLSSTMQILAKGADIASANALALGNDGNYFDVTGTTNITSIDTVGVGAQITLQFDAALTITHHATNLITPDGTDLVTEAGDHVSFVEYDTGKWRVTYTSIAPNVNVSAVQFSPITAPAHSEGLVYYDSDEKALSYYNEESDVTINLGHESVIRVINNTGGDIDNGAPVYMSGAAGGLPEIAKAIATASSETVLGIATQDILDTATGYVTLHGVVRGIDTSGFSVGDTLYVSASVAGELVNAAPAYPNESITIGTVIVDAVDGKIFAAVEKNQSPTFISKSYTFASRSTSSGVYYQAGFYDAPAADANLTNASPTVVFGEANHAYMAHAFAVSGGAGATDGSDLVLTVSGTSLASDGTRTPADSEIVVADCLAGASAVDTYTETPKKWIGSVTYTLTSTAGTTFSFDFNYGFCKYEDFGNQDFILRGSENVGLCNASDSGFNIEILHHDASGWTYSAAAFVAGSVAVANMNTDCSTEQDITAGEQFAWKRTGLTHAISGSGSEGLVIRVTTGVNNSISYMDSHLGVTVA